MTEKKNIINLYYCVSCFHKNVFDIDKKIQIYIPVYGRNVNVFYIQNEIYNVTIGRVPKRKKFLNRKYSR